MLFFESEKNNVHEKNRKKDVKIPNIVPLQITPRKDDDSNV